MQARLHFVTVTVSCGRAEGHTGKLTKECPLQVHQQPVEVLCGLNICCPLVPANSIVHHTGEAQAVICIEFLGLDATNVSSDLQCKRACAD